jgi:tetratricopeptide (TPR) repeat protein
MLHARSCCNRGPLDSRLRRSLGMTIQNYKLSSSTHCFHFPLAKFRLLFHNTNQGATVLQTTVNRYRRTDVLRILRITARQLVQWEKASLVAPTDTYSFFDLLQLRKVRELRAKRVRPAVIRQSLQAMLKQVAGMENPLLEAGTFSTGARIAFRHEGHAVEPIAGQFVMDFHSSGKVVPTNVKSMPAATTVAEYFARGVALEEDPASHQEAIAAYEKVLELDPGHAAAHINVGTLYYNFRDFIKAEQHYRRAIEADPRYALAYFDLGNVLDETGRLEEAIRTYGTALQLAPTYADAHYNLALAYDKQKEPRKALRHWRAYIRLDTSGPWFVHALNQIRRILQGDTLKVVFRRK